MTTLEHQIADEERIVGIPTDQPLTNAVDRPPSRAGRGAGRAHDVRCRRRRSRPAASGLRVFTSALALAFGVYAVQKEHHLQRLSKLYRDECSINLTVADSILRSGVLRADRELLDLRSAVEHGARPASPPTCSTSCPPTARRCGSSGLRVRPRSRRCATPATPRSGSTRRPRTKRCGGASRSARARRDGRTVIAVPLEHQHHVLGVLEVISGPASFYSAYDAELVSVFAYGAVSGLLSGRRAVEAP